MPLQQPVKALIFDWGNTIMRDFELPGPMSQWQHVAWIPGAEEALKELSENYECAIATSADHSDTGKMIEALKRVGADTYFKHFFSSKDLGYQKPDPKFFQSIAEKLGVDISACVMIGNFYLKDIRGAKQAGMQTVFFNEKNLPGAYEDADEIIHSMDELAGVIGSG
ncbi:MAG: HAD family hydrolase [Bacteroidales bacterium]